MSLNQINKSIEFFERSLYRLKKERQAICPHEHIQFEPLCYIGEFQCYEGGTATCKDCGLYGSMALPEDIDKNYKLLEKIYKEKHNVSINISDNSNQSLE